MSDIFDSFDFFRQKVIQSGQGNMDEIIVLDKFQKYTKIILTNKLLSTTRNKL